MLEYLSKENDKVVDPFSGSGVVPYVARRMNRQYLGVELDEDVYNASVMQTAIA
jgi:site-specific DNA-methyltransferase (adenine-specific)